MQIEFILKSPMHKKNSFGKYNFDNHIFDK